MFGLKVPLVAALWNPGDLARRGVRWFVVVGTLALLAAAMSRVNADGSLDDVLRRYPFVLVWVQAALSWSVQGWGRAVSSGPEAVRLLPLLSLLGMAVWWSVKTAPADPAASPTGPTPASL